MIADYLLNNQAQIVLSREHELAFKGFMMAYYAITNLQNLTITEDDED